MNLTAAILNSLGLRSLMEVEYVIIHHSVANKQRDITEIAMDEESSQGFITVGYHAYVKCVDNIQDIWVVQQGRPIQTIPAAAYGLNTQSYDICIAGNYQPGALSYTDTPSEHMLKVAAGQILQAKRKLPNVKWLIGHRDVAPLKAKQGLDPADYSTACPGDLLYAQLDVLRKLTGLGKPAGL